MTETGILESSIGRNSRLFQCSCPLSYVSMVLFELVTKYKNWEEIRKGNRCSRTCDRWENFWGCKYFSILNRTA